MESAAEAAFSRETVMLSIVASLLLAAAPTNATHRILIVAGGKGSEEAEAAIWQIRSLKDARVKPAFGYPVVVDSSRVVGLNPGFVIAVYGVCALKDLQCLLTLEVARRQVTDDVESGGAGLAGAYYRDVVWSRNATAPALSRTFMPPLAIVPGPKTADLELWAAQMSGSILVLGGAAAGPAGERRVLLDAPVLKTAGGKPAQCVIESPGGKRMPPHAVGKTVVITWVLAYEKKCKLGDSGYDTLEIIETVSAREGKIHRAFRRGELTRGTCEEVQGD